MSTLKPFKLNLVKICSFNRWQKFTGTDITPRVKINNSKMCALFKVQFHSKKNIHGQRLSDIIYWRWIKYFYRHVWGGLSVHTIWTLLSRDYSYCLNIKNIHIYLFTMSIFVHRVKRQMETKIGYIYLM